MKVVRECLRGWFLIIWNYIDDIFCFDSGSCSLRKCCDGSGSDDVVFYSGWRVVRWCRLDDFKEVSDLVILVENFRKFYGDCIEVVEYFIVVE